MANNSLRNKAVIITGATGDIGQALCSAFSEAGYFVIATSPEMLSQTKIGDVFIEQDLLRLAIHPKVASRFKASVLGAIPQADMFCIINNAAVQIIGDFQELSAADFTTSFQVNVVAPFVLTQLFVNELTASGGNVLNIGTVHSQATKSGFTAYSTSKTALHGLTRALAVELGGKVRVNTLAPAAIQTAMLSEGFAKTPDLLQLLESYHPAGRIGSVDEVAQAALFLCSEKATFITGATLFMDGGILSKLHDPA